MQKKKLNFKYLNNKFIHISCNLKLENWTNFLLFQSENNFWNSFSLSLSLHFSSLFFFGFLLWKKINQASNHLDLSQLYGYSENVVNMLRAHTNGELKISNDPQRPTLPEIDDIGMNYLCMHNTTIDTVCYQAGDTRVNVNPYVTTLYTLFLRSHNRLARLFKKSQPTWSDDELFAAARQTNMAIYQKIVFEEWLNVVLGRTDTDAINANDIICKMNDAVSNEFATAGIRFYYSMMPGDLKTTKDVGYFVRQSNIIIRPMTE